MCVVESAVSEHAGVIFLGLVGADGGCGLVVMLLATFRCRMSTKCTYHCQTCRKREGNQS